MQDPFLPLLPANLLNFLISSTRYPQEVAVNAQKNATILPQVGPILASKVNWEKELLATSFKRISIFVLILIGSSAIGALRAEVMISESEFRDLARDLAPRVNLFAEVWKSDPKAIFYGGTSRDFLYWILGKLQGAKTREELDRKIERLRKRTKIIDIKDIVGGESDIDVVTEKFLPVSAEKYGVMKIDRIEPSLLDPKTELGETQRLQGHIPVEKIELSMSGLRTSEYFGNGVEEILTGNLSVHFAPEEIFWKTYYAKKNWNHPVFLALRYLRVRAAHWSKTHDRGLPNKDGLMDFDSRTKAELTRIIDQASRDPKLKKVLATEKGFKLFNATVLKAFRSYTNPTAAYYLLSAFGYEKLLYASKNLTSINQFLFAQYRDQKAIAKAFKDFQVQPENIFVPIKKFLPNLKIYHGTPSDQSFRGILFLNILPSIMGSAGRGFYGVASKNIWFAENRGQSADRVVVVDVSSDAKMIDISRGPGRALFKKWKTKTGGDEDGFAAAFGADILKYEYTPAAYVVKNSAVLGARQGLTRQLLTVQMAVELGQKVQDTSDVEKLLRSLSFNAFSELEIEMVLDEVPLVYLQDFASKAEKLKGINNTLLFSVLRRALPHERGEFAKKILLQAKSISEFHSDDAVSLLERTSSEARFELKEVELLIDFMIDRRIEIEALVSAIVADRLGEISIEQMNIWMGRLLGDPRTEKIVLSALAFAARNGSAPMTSKWYAAAEPWLDQIIRGARLDREVVNSSVLTSPSPKKGDLRWAAMARNRGWVDRFVKMDRPPYPILELIERAAKEGEAGHVSGTLLTAWVERLIENPTFSRENREAMVQSIFPYKLKSPIIRDFIVGALPKRRNMRPKKYFCEHLVYLKESYPDDVEVQRAVARSILLEEASSIYVIEYMKLFFNGIRVTDIETLNLLSKIVKRFSSLESKDYKLLVDGLLKPSFQNTTQFQSLAIDVLSNLAKKYSLVDALYESRGLEIRESTLPDLLNLIFQTDIHTESMQFELRRLFFAHPFLLNAVSDKKSVHERLDLPDGFSAQSCPAHLKRLRYRGARI